MASSKILSPYVLDAADEFLRTKAAREPKTRASYSAVLLGSPRGTKKPLGQPLSVYFHNRKLSSLTYDEVAAWFVQRVSGGAQDTKSRISKAAREFFRFAASRGYTTLRLDSAIDVYRAGGPRIDFLSWEEVDDLLGAISEWRYRFAAAWLFLTGCRVQEACGARQRDVRWHDDLGFFKWTVHNSKTHTPRLVWLPDRLRDLVNQSRELNRPRPDWPLLWDCDGRGFGRVESPLAYISQKTINGALEKARDAIGLPVRVTAHVARHTYATNWIRENGDGEISLTKLSHQVGTSVSVLRSTYVHISLTEDDWQHLHALGARKV